MKGRYVIRDQGRLIEYTDFDDILSVFDHLIAFEPEEVPGPHTHQQHEEMSMLNTMLNQLMSRER